MNNAPSKTALLQYSILAFPLAFAGLPLYIHAPDFYTRNLGLSVGLIGIILLAIRLFDALQDPVIGYISDQYARLRFAIVIAGLVMLTGGMAAVFYGPQWGVSVALWFTFSMILATTGFSIVTINLSMIGGLWYDAPRQRTRISAWREAFTLLGLLVASTLPAALHIFNPAEEAFRLLFWIFAVVMVFGFVMFTGFMRQISSDHKITQTHTQVALSFVPILSGQNRHFFAVCFLTHLAAAIPGVMVLFFIRDYLDAEHLSGLFLFLYFIAGALFMPVWVRLANRIGKERAWLSGMLLAVAVFIWAFFLQPDDIVAYAIICVLSGTALGADLALPPSILADRITQQQNEATATQYYAVIAFIPKTTMAIASGGSFLVLDYLGFVAGAENTPTVLQGIIVLYALIPCAIKLIAAYTLWHTQT